MREIRRVHQARAALLACGAALLWSAGTAFATEPPPAGQTAPTARPMHGDHPAPTKEEREKMAQAHEKMAACLRSDRPMSDCHAEMMKLHDQMMHDHPMMGHSTPEAAPK